MRHIPAYLIYARGRPHLWHRLYLRVLYFGSFSHFWIIDVLATITPQLCFINGIPNSSNNLIASESFIAVVAIVTCNPRILSMSL